MTQPTLSITTNPELARITIPTANGYLLSIGFGDVHYCPSLTNYDHAVLRNTHFELAVIRHDGNFVRLRNHDDVVGWIPAEALAPIIEYVSLLSPSEHVNWQGAPHPDGYGYQRVPLEVGLGTHIENLSTLAQRRLDEVDQEAYSQWLGKAPWIVALCVMMVPVAVAIVNMVTRS